MDPTAALHAAAEALAAGDIDAAREHLRDYQAWRNLGGFAPPNGDQFAVAIRQALIPKNLQRIRAALQLTDDSPITAPTLPTDTRPPADDANKERKS